MRTLNEIKQDIQARLESMTGSSISDGTLIDFFNTAVSEAMEDIYKEIDANKNPHLWSSLNGSSLDDMGVMLNIPRKTGELDESYKYRIMNWVLSNEASNERAISNELLNPTYASDISFHPYTKGSGTATCYVIPINYNQVIIENALKEAADKVKNIASPSLYVEYVVPEIKSVKLHILISSSEGDLDYIKENIKIDIKNYINSLAPNEYLEVGKINKIGIKQSMVDYFNVLSIIIDGVDRKELKILQKLDTKMLFDEIIWTEE